MISQMKLATSLVFFPLAILILSLSGCGPRTTPAAAVERVLNECAAVSQQVNGSSLTPGQSATFIADSFQQIDTRDCPQEFRRAFQLHITAWRNAAPYFEANNTATVLLEGAAAIYTGDPAWMQAQAKAAEANQIITDSYIILTDLAVSYGARVPRSVVEK